jgi:hypothetical protein
MRCDDVGARRETGKTAAAGLVPAFAGCIGKQLHMHNMWCGGHGVMSYRHLEGSALDDGE